MNLRPKSLSSHEPLRSEEECRALRAAKHYGKTIEAIRKIVSESVKKESDRANS